MVAQEPGEGLAGEVPSRWGNQNAASQPTQDPNALGEPQIWPMEVVSGAAPEERLMVARHFSGGSRCI